LNFCRYTALSAALLLTACNSDEKVISENPENITGSWRTSGCNEFILPEGVVSSLPYGYIVYHFTVDGNLNMQTISYLESDCSSEKIDSPISDSFAIYNLEMALSDGGGGLLPILISLEIPDNPISFETYYTILNGNLLCTSQSLDLNLESALIGDLGDDINYNQCLEKI